MFSFKWSIWLVLSISMFFFLGLLMFAPYQMPLIAESKTLLLPGKTTDGHYQIELKCDVCHTEAFASKESIQKACVRCHGEELKQAEDSHPRRKFTDPRNAERVEILDARWCTSCHQEHRPEQTSAMGLSLPVDYCFKCHEHIGEERATHKNLSFTSCGSSGCHNFHDNRALYEDFLIRHQDEPPIKPNPVVPTKTPTITKAHEPLTSSEHDAPKVSESLQKPIETWAASAHAQAGVNCSGCHQSNEKYWKLTVEPDVCASCHQAETEGFLSSRHGMRMNIIQQPMQPSLARLPMTLKSRNTSLSCHSCHQSHTYDTQSAAVEACLGCHDDQHTRSYQSSKHYVLWQQEIAGQSPKGSGVSCATCHLPRTKTHPLRTGIAVDHNQNDYLRPNEKMIRPVCMQCHGLEFTLNALADSELIKSNFQYTPKSLVDSIRFATILRWSLQGRTPPWDSSSAKPKKKEQTHE